MRVRPAGGAAQEWRDLGGTRDLVRQLRRDEHGFATGLELAFGDRHHFDHGLVGFARLGAEDEDAVLVQDQTGDLRIGVEHFGSRLGEAEARPAIGHDAEPVAIGVACAFLAIGLIDQTEQCGRMGVIGELVGRERVQQRFHGRIGRRRIDQIGAQHAHDLVVGDVIEQA